MRRCLQRAPAPKKESSAPHPLQRLLNRRYNNGSILFFFCLNAQRHTHTYNYTYTYSIHTQKQLSKATYINTLQTYEPILASSKISDNPSRLWHKAVVAGCQVACLFARNPGRGGAQDNISTTFPHTLDLSFLSTYCTTICKMDVVVSEESHCRSTRGQLAAFHSLEAKSSRRPLGWSLRYYAPVAPGPAGGRQNTNTNTNTKRQKMAWPSFFFLES